MYYMFIINILCFIIYVGICLIIKVLYIFQVNVGVRQGCNMSPTLFNVMLDNVMKEVRSLDENFSMSAQMSTDIRYADDTTLISTIFNKLKIATGELEKACQKWGLKINPNKCAILSPEHDAEIEIDGEKVPKVDKFIFLGSLVPDCGSDVKRRISLASQAFGRLRSTIWREIFQEILKQDCIKLLSDQ